MISFYIFFCLKQLFNKLHICRTYSEIFSKLHLMNIVTFKPSPPYKTQLKKKSFASSSANVKRRLEKFQEQSSLMFNDKQQQ